jgi:hypothetical protein
MMTCKRCGCTQEKPCTPPCAWMLPNLCTSCLTPEEAAIDRQYASLFENLREELKQDRYERFLLAVVTGMTSDSSLLLRDAADVERFVVRVMTLASALSDATDPDPDVEDDAPKEEPRIVTP